MTSIATKSSHPKLSVLVMLVLLAFSASSVAERPNILILLADDLGWNDVSYHGSQIRTPNIDRIAQSGIELDRYYVQPTCSPTRAALMTGKLPMRLGLYRPINKNGSHGVPLDEKLLPQYLAELGYQRYAVGKWHMGHYQRGQTANARGFEHYYGSMTGGIGFWSKVHGGGYDWQRNGKTVREPGYATHLLVNEVQSLIRQRDTTRPTFMYVAFQAPHLPNEAPQQAVSQYAGQFGDHPTRHMHAGMVHEMDQAIGQILTLYEEEGMLDNTIVLFSSDNGGLVQPGPVETRTGTTALATRLMGWFDRPMPIDGFEFLVANTFDAGSDNTPLTGAKATYYEGGARVPGAIWWPGHLQSSDAYTAPITVVDVLPTLLDALGEDVSALTHLDGRSQLAALQGGQSQRMDYVTSDMMANLTIYQWPWKLIATDDPQLYNVMEDPLEQQDLAAAQPQRVASMRMALAEYEFAEDPGIPWFDVLFDPDTFGGEEDGRPAWPDAVRD